MSELDDFNKNLSRDIILVLAAMESEVEELRKLLSKEIVRIDDPLGRIFVYEYKKGKYVAIAVTGVGKVMSASFTQHAIDLLGPNYVIMIGIAGAVSGSLKVGDVVCATGFIQYDLDATGFGYEVGDIPLADERISYPKPDPNLLDLVLKLFYDDESELNYGVIGTSDSFICKLNRNNWIDEFDKLGICAVEMEGASVATVCARNDVPFILFRAISDLVYENVVVDFDKVEKEMSVKLASVAKKLIEEIYNE